ncbi:hypothetical protein RKE29_01430 [Streptomyces sp. B1866]|uniref:type II toxin-antitoxin system RelE family toxin n=1 Tax=Streptomyces sp. B1866 TaxID=3075431 RepID=UPI00288FC58C|nr:hypothetical protein [Streptomyces sp. B1866]MDT3395322.1 hypothetical protein [Streptomyces sp. B1866]
MSRARFAFAAHPDALEDLRRLPKDIQHLALLGLQQLVHADQRGQALEDRPGRPLHGARKLYVDPAVQWRLVYQERPAPAGSEHRREIYLIAAGPRRDAAVYTLAAQRLHTHRTTQAAQSTEPSALRPRAEAARARSPYLRTTPTRAAPPRPADSHLLMPVPSSTRKGIRS